MVSRTALICKRYAAGCTKTEPKILSPKNKEKEKNAPEIVRKGRNRVRFGCWREVQPVRKGTRTRSPNQNAPHSHATHVKRKPAETQCFRRFLAGAEGLEPSARGFGVDVGTNRQERGRTSVARFSRTSPKRVVLVWCCEKNFRAKTPPKEQPFSQTACSKVSRALVSTSILGSIILKFQS